ncbi:hypothetical protein SB766_12660 [Pseudomonas sp. SIMBA_077]
MQKITVMAAMALLVGCSTTEPDKAPFHDTQACMNYRSMMTAPMAPDAMQRLKLACEQSRQ